MANLKIPVEINCIDIVRKAVNELIEDFDTEEDASADYWKGAKDFGKAIISTISTLDRQMKDTDTGEAHAANDTLLKVNGAYGMFPEAFVKEAIAKRLKLSPVMKPIQGFSSDTASQLCCPSCGEPVINYLCKNVNSPYCMMCGQALDWGER